MTDDETIGVYAARVAEYAALTGQVDAAPFDAFVARLPSAGRVLDWGCGPGHDAARLAALGFEPDPVDATPAMVAHAVAGHGLPARVATFDELDAVGAYDGVWANFSLLHAGRDDAARHVRAARRALRDGGAFYLSVKVGRGEGRDGLGRRYTYFGEAELTALLEAAGFRIEATFGGVSTGLDGVRATWTGRLAGAPPPGG